MKKQLVTVLKKTVRVNELKIHPACSSFYSVNDEENNSLMQDIKEKGLINESFYCTKDNEVFIGVRRVRILQQMNYQKEIVVNVADATDDEIIDMMISSNKHRKKTIADTYNEINFLKNKLSPGQGSRSDLKGKYNTNTMELVAKQLGISISNLYKIIKIQENDPGIGLLVDRGEMSIHEASEEIRMSQYKNKPTEKQPKKGKLSFKSSDIEEYVLEVSDDTERTYPIRLSNGNIIQVKIKFVISKAA